MSLSELQYRSSHSEVFLEKGVLKICCEFTGEHNAEVWFQSFSWSSRKDKLVTTHEKNVQILWTEVFQVKNSLTSEIMTDVFKFKDHLYGSWINNSTQKHNTKSWASVSDTRGYQGILNKSGGNKSCAYQGRETSSRPLFAF